MILKNSSLMRYFKKKWAQITSILLEDEMGLLLSLWISPCFLESYVLAFFHFVLFLIAITIFVFEKYMPLGFVIFYGLGGYILYIFQRKRLQFTYNSLIETYKYTCKSNQRLTKTKKLAVLIMGIYFLAFPITLALFFASEKNNILPEYLYVNSLTKSICTVLMFIIFYSAVLPTNTCMICNVLVIKELYLLQEEFLKLEVIIDKLNQNELEKFIVFGTKRLIQVKRILKQTSNATKWMFFVLFSTGLGIICSTLKYLYFSKSLFIGILSFCILVISAAVAFPVILFGQIMENEFETLRLIIENCPWYNFNLKNKKILLTLIMINQRISGFSFFGLLNLDFMLVKEIFARVYALISCWIRSTCYSGVIYGLSYAWTSPGIPVILEDKHNYNITETEASYFTVLPYFAMMITIVPITYLNDLIGRKPTLFLMVIPCMLHWILIGFAKTVYVFYIARLFIGISEFIFTTLPMYLGEISTPKIRGSWGNTFNISINLGMLLINIIQSYCGIVKTSCICLLFCIVFIMIIPAIPESPYYYLMKKKTSEAKETLKWLHQKEHIEADLELIESNMEIQLQEDKSWASLLKNKQALSTAIFLQISIPFCGITAFVAYNQQIFRKVTGTISSETSGITVALMMFLLSIISGWTADRFGRKKSFTYSALGCSILLLIESLYFWCDSKNYNFISYLNWIPLTIMIAFFVFYALGIGTISLLMLEELFPLNIKTKGLCLCSIFFGLASALNNEIFHILEYNYGLHASFLYFAISCTILFMSSIFIIPETSGKTLEEIQSSFKQSTT